MRKRLAMALPTAALLVGASALPAVAATNPDSGQSTTPSTQSGTQPDRHAVGNAGGTIASLTVGGSTVPGHLLGENAIASGAIAYSSAKTNSETDNKNEHSKANAAPLAFEFGGNEPQTFGDASQSALPDHTSPDTGGVEIPDNPLIQGKIIPSSAQARYSAKLGPCVKPLADSSTSIASLYIGNLNTGLGDNLDLTNALSQNAMSKLDLQKGDDLSQLPDLQHTLQSILNFGNNNGSDNAPDFSLLALPKTVHSHSTVKLVDTKGSDNKAVQSTSKIQLADITLFKGAPEIETHIKIVSQPKLTVTSTGDKDTSSVSYDAPIFKITQGGKQIGPTYNLANDADSQAEIPLHFLPLSGNDALDIFHSDSPLKNLLPEGFSPEKAQQNGEKTMASIPFVGNFSHVTDALPTNVTDITESNVLDLGVIKLGIGSLSKQGQQKSSPFDGYQLGATSNIFDLQVLPTTGSNGLLSNGFLNNVTDSSSSNGSSALLDVAFGKQTAKAYAPTGGVDCSAPEKPAPAAPVSNPTPPQPQSPPLAYTGAYDTVPLFWTGTGLVLGGGVLLAGFAARRRKLAKLSGKDSE